MSELSTLGLAHSHDAREIAEMSRDLVEHGLPWSWTPTRVQHFINGDDSQVVVARNTRRGDPRYGIPVPGVSRGIDGFAIMHFADELAHLNLLAVAPESRRQGIGRQLLEWLVTTAVEAGVFRIDLELRTQNDAARAFYESLGFAQQGVVPATTRGAKQRCACPAVWASTHDPYVRLDRTPSGRRRPGVVALR